MASEHSQDLMTPPALLEMVDKLRELNIGCEISLPQLVVAGDQGSGKSSLLESLIGIPFPKSQDLCTRFATQISCRRVQNEIVKISILPGPNASEDHRKEVQGLQLRLESSAQFRTEFEDIMSQVCYLFHEASPLTASQYYARLTLTKASKTMGLRTDMQGDNGAVFSEDVLKIELHGPNQDPLTIIDIPGLFRTREKGVSKTDMDMVRVLVKRYIQNERAIILAVLPSNAEFAASEILELAEEYDPDGMRTIGVLTKPDLVTEPSKQDTVLALMEGRKRPLRLGYYLVRNKGEHSGPSTPLMLDDTLRTSPWNTLPADRRGIVALKKQLGIMLPQLTKQALPALRTEVSNQIKILNSDLNNLGPARQHDHDQRRFLFDIAEKFQSRVQKALTGDYPADSHNLQKEHFRLITRITNISEKFQAACTNLGHTREFENIGKETASPADTSVFSVAGDDDLGEICSIRKESEMLDDPVTSTINQDLAGILSNPKIPEAPKHGIRDWISSIYLETRGLDLGTFNSNVIKTAFVEQSRKWADLASQYMDDIIKVLHEFITSCLIAVCQDTLVRKEIWSLILDHLIERYKDAIDQAQLLVLIERQHKPFTLNPQFTKSRRELQLTRLTELLRPIARVDQSHYGEPQQVVSLDVIRQTAETKSNVEHIQDEIHDILYAYYGLALSRFVDNILQQVVNYRLLYGPCSPLTVFTQSWVVDLSREQLRQIAGETRSAGRKRSTLEKEIEKHSQALKILMGI